MFYTSPLHINVLAHMHHCDGRLCNDGCMAQKLFISGCEPVDSFGFKPRG
jgi:hypothetical protein